MMEQARNSTLVLRANPFSHFEKVVTFFSPSPFLHPQIHQGLFLAS